MAGYRLGKFDEAIDWLKKTEANQGRQDHAAVLQLCGGELSILSPEAMDEKLRRVAGQLYGINAPEIPKSHTWEIEWTSDVAISALDQWQTGGWSRRLYDLIIAHACELNGWEIGPKRE